MQTVKVPDPSASDRKTVAREHSALFPTMMALARWSNGVHPFHLHADGLPLRASWYAQAQRNFQAWLDHGGFTQYDEPEHSGPPAPDGKAHSADVCID
jgi:hypothetical protein